MSDRSPSVHIAVVMGVSGSGKTTVGRIIAERLDWTFAEGDSLHPPENVAKMASGHALDDADRWPWLQRVRDWIDEQVAAGRSGVVTCSALKRSYRDLLSKDRPEVVFVHLAGTAAQITERLVPRHGHFMPAALLDSQFHDLQPLGPDENGIEVDVAGTAESIADSAVRRLTALQD
jgi:gluconokinase